MTQKRPKKKDAEGDQGKRGRNEQIQAEETEKDKSEKIKVTG